MVLSLLGHERLVLSPQDELGMSCITLGTVTSDKRPMQSALDSCYVWLCNQRKEQAYIWNTQEVKRWGKNPATEKQLTMIKKRCKGFNMDSLTKGQASQILNRLMSKGGRL